MSATVHPAADFRIDPGRRFLGKLRRTVGRAIKTIARRVRTGQPPA